MTVPSLNAAIEAQAERAQATTRWHLAFYLNLSFLQATLIRAFLYCPACEKADIRADHEIRAKTIAENKCMDRIGTIGIILRPCKGVAARPDAKL